MGLESFSLSLPYGIWYGTKDIHGYPRIFVFHAFFYLWCHPYPVQGKHRLCTVGRNIHASFRRPSAIRASLGARLGYGWSMVRVWVLRPGMVHSKSQKFPFIRQRSMRWRRLAHCASLAQQASSQKACTVFESFCRLMEYAVPVSCTLDMRTALGFQVSAKGVTFSNRLGTSCLVCNLGSKECFDACIDRRCTFG